MNPGKYIYHTLSNNAAVSSAFQTRFRPEINNTGGTLRLPYLVYSVNSNEPTNTKGASGASDLDTVNVTISIFQDNYEQLVSNGAAVRAALDYTVGSGAYAEIQHVSFQGEGYEFDDDYKPRGLYILNQSYQFRIKR